MNPTARPSPAFGLPLSVRMVMIDLDGTLIHTAPDLAAAANRMLVDLDLPTHDPVRIERWIGNGVGRLVKRALTGDFEAEPQAALYARAYPRFLHHYGEHVASRSRPYPGVTEGLRALTEAGFSLVCVTNKAEAFTVPLLRALALDGYFGLVLSGDTLAHKKPHPEPLLHACRYFDIPPARGVLVGDSANDAQAARAAGMALICVSYGYNQIGRAHV